MSSRSGSTRDYETSGQSCNHSASPPVPESSDPETEGLIFYHMDLYGSKERFDIFPEELSGRGDRSLGDTRREFALSSEKVQRPPEAGYDLEKEVAELAKMYGLDEDREKELELLEGHLEKVESRWPPARTEKARSQGSTYNSSKSRSSVKDPSQSTKQQGLPDEASEGENQSKARADDEAESNIWSRGGLSSGGMSDEWNSQVVSEEEEEEEEEAADVFCSTCKIPIRAFDKLFGEHKDHEVAQLPNAVESEKEEIHKNMCKLEEQIAQMENVASHLEEIFITVEENFGRQEKNFEVHYNDAVQVLAQKYEEQLDALGEEKRQKLEALYEQLVNCGKHLDTCKELTDETQELFLENDKAEFMKAAVTMVDRLEEFLKKEVDLELSTLPEFEERVIDVSEVEQLMNSINAIPAPCAPVINPQAPNAATGTSLRVCWGLFSDDTVECYQLCYKPVSNEMHSDEQAEHTLKIKETYCTITDLVPNTQYEFWVSALNASGVSPPSERAVYVTAPSPPTIKSKKIRSCENAALVCWESRDINPVDSYTVELSKLTDEENDDTITESIVGIPNCEVLIHLQPAQKYHICVRAQNLGGSSERSEPVLIHTTGTCFYLNEDTAHPLLAILDDGFTISCDELENPECDLPVYDNSFTRCIAILGSLIPFPGKHYWEVEVEEDTEYRTGVAFENTPRHGHLGANNSSWCMRHIITPSRHKYEFLHSGMTPDIRITIPPRRIGILLDYENCRLSFFNADIAQHLHTFNSRFQHYVHPCFALETPGILRIHTGITTPPWTALP
ncbi:fibronectin type III and SPRY domain-containing protein 2 [Corvus hawaiiensis]|uniref:fibronectin type III and SPRY domain-containing protein 2 n=1 Tax=Corvus hawaiiensis TaxID=134902 RepID=UPI0020193EC9|nr:fibronectin type III and SPRY domain-containing protein 2 [Corvus hawaiiensis]XP_048173732.1 fibronectin type III and SPRY domain-containing protein 2 [Corvus hawaiiensis]XP_048173733.1 fibronectin type III and SPRY domain-containing protein 2 [Corvus hawaiiensis]XP_048173734.1 fibronectin type III and SPRY domain-containing protein 2 [Corvus hawaiiensis]XP_048173735.1 fibronectin type III and SPRY domain-containing protein 2 [Corvus hawaiiensis]